ncbi:MAG: hypothetical protein K8H86_15200, partial [Ignavibacteriaceae bacterium]|nr:hypothetical protein [Ignavibacteriaceae bacterium]
RKYYPRLASDIENFRNTRVIPIIKTLLKIGKKKKMILDIPDEIILLVFTSALGHIADSEAEIFSKQSYHQTFRYAFNILLNGILTKKGRQILNYKLEVNK